MQNLAATKIVATIGPASWDNDILHEMIKNGMQIARINASFADQEELGRVSTQIRKLSSKVAIMLDTMGHKVRVGDMEGVKEFEKGKKVTIVSKDQNKLPSDTISTTYPNLFQYVKEGDSILIDDGNVRLTVSSVLGQEIVCSVEQGGSVKKGKTVNIPNVHLDFEPLNEKDRADIQFAIENNFDLISASYIRNMEDVLVIRELLGDSKIKLIAKIENAEGVENFDRILGVVDGIMVARGDLGVELPLEQVPILQKQFILKCRQRGKLSIVATQMLESMRENSRPTRAEVSDVANAIMDGTDAVMLSAETSAGKYPVEAVRTMNRVAYEAEKVLRPQLVTGRTDASEDTDTLCKYIFSMVNDLNLKGVISLSQSGKTLRSLARHRLNVPIWNVSPNPRLIRQLNSFRGVHGVYIKDFRNDRDETIVAATEVVYAQGNLELSDKIAIISGSSITNKGINSIIEISTVREILGQ